MNMPTLSAVDETTRFLRSQIVGLDRQVPVLGGTHRPYTFLDNAASTPSLLRVKETVNNLLDWYASIHRGTGFKSLISTEAYERSRELVAEFVGADPRQDVVIFGKNTTEAINTLANAFPFEAGDVVVVTLMEHHSNDLPWRCCARVEHFGVNPEGQFDLQAFDDLLKQFQGRVKIVSTTGASNVSGFMPPIHDMAEIAHRHGAMILVDCAQLAPHRSIDMGPADSPRHIDFVSLSAHKMYAPFGTGALIGPREFFDQGRLNFRGGGTIEVVTLDEVYWAGSPDRYEAGSPNVIGAAAMGAAVKALTEIGMDRIAEHEKLLTTYAIEQFSRIPGVSLYGCKDPQRVEDRVGVIPLMVDGMPHGKTAAILSYEYAIGVRSGCFCAHPYVLNLLGIDHDAFEHYKGQVLHHDRSEIPGLVRISFGCYNTESEVDLAAEALEAAASGKYQGEYQLDRSSGSYAPVGFDARILDEYFQL